MWLIFLGLVLWLIFFVGLVIGIFVLTHINMLTGMDAEIFRSPDRAKRIGAERLYKFKAFQVKYMALRGQLNPDWSPLYDENINTMVMGWFTNDNRLKGIEVRVPRTIDPKDKSAQGRRDRFGQRAQSKVEFLSHWPSFPKNESSEWLWWW